MKAAREAGLSSEEIRSVVREAEAVRIEAARSIAGYARGLLGDPDRDAEPAGDPSDSFHALVQVGAAAGANAGHVLDRLLPRARAGGLTDEAMTEALEVAAVVKTMASNVFGRDAERALGREREGPTAPTSTGCAAPVQAEPDEPVPAAPKGCC